MDQGVRIQVVGRVDGRETELLRFDCCDLHPCYHYAPEGANERVMLDTTLIGNPIRWAIKQLDGKLVDMLQHAGYDAIAATVDRARVSQTLPELEAARQTAIMQHNYTVHNRGTEVIEAGNIRFGLEMRTVGKDGGPAIHVLGDVAGQEIELLAFDFFRLNPHYHYGPRYRNERIYWDTTLVPDPLESMLEHFKRGKLPAMIVRAGYPTIAAGLDEELLAATLPEVESRIKAMAQAALR